MSIRAYLEVSGCCHAQKPSVLDTSVIYLFIPVEWLHFLLLSLPFPIYKMGILRYLLSEDYYRHWTR